MSRLPRFLVFAVTSAALSLATGCAFTHNHVDPSPVSAEPAPSGRGRGREVILVGPFADARDDKRRCGVKKNGMGLVIGDLPCDGAPGQWVADALAIRLSREGYRVLSSDAVPGPSTIVVHGAVKKHFIEPHAFAVQGDAAVDLVMTSASGFHAEKSVDVRVKKPIAISMGDQFQAAGDHTTTTLAIDAASAIGDVLEAHPELGAPGATRASLASR